MDEKTPEVTHPDWCQRDRCTVDADGKVMHGHLFGEVAGIEVAAERVDAPDDSGTVKAGQSQVFTRINRTGRLTPKEIDRLARLSQKASEFIGSRMYRGGGF
ncbi:MAG TPA: hypothetical protein VJ777_22945 [Mycobacterium sp.]|nr:hypothetical protein [Mycobacterium sp.]